MEEAVHDFLREIDNRIVQVATGEISIPTWDFHSKNITQADMDHLENLKIPAVMDNPSLLLHDIGRFFNDLVLRKRVENVFMPHHHTFLFSTSGSGKTRLLLEGLCQNWGFYFTSLVHHSPPATHFSNNPKTPHRNPMIAKRILRRAFLARLIIFTTFVEKIDLRRVPHSPLDEYKKRWLYLQIFPRLGHPQDRDVFEELATKLAEASEDYITACSKEYLERVHYLIAPEKRGTRQKTTLFCALDAALFVTKERHHSSRSDNKNGDDKLILREMVRVWEDQSQGKYIDIFMIVTGTGISSEGVGSVLESAMANRSMYRKYTDTGAFDTQEAQRQYLTKYLPRSLIESKSGIRLLDRLWYWLRGRHRFTAGYVEELIRNGFRQPHRLLNAYVKHFAGFSISDAVEYMEKEEQLPEISQHQLDFSLLKRDRHMLVTIYKVITHNIISSTALLRGVKEAMSIEHGFARIRGLKKHNVFLDEHLVLLAAFQWMHDNHQSVYEDIALDIRKHTAKNNGLEIFIAVSLDLIFSQPRRLSEVFDFHGTIPAWAHKSARLVSVFRDDAGNVETSDSSFFKSVTPSATFRTDASDAKDTLLWLQHRDHAPFCFPHQWMRPDILFVLKLEDGSQIWVALQSKWSKEKMIQKGMAMDAVESVTPSKYFFTKKGKPHLPSPNMRDDTLQYLLELPHKRSDAGKYSLLRAVVSFPAPTKLSTYIHEDPDEDGHPLATLNMTLVKEVTREHSPEGILEIVEDDWREELEKKSVDSRNRWTKETNRKRTRELERPEGRSLRRRITTKI